MSWEVSIIEVGIIPGLPRSLYVSEAAPEEVLDVPCFAYLLENGATAMLVDTGPDRAEATVLGYRIVGDTRAALLRGISLRGLRAGDIDVVVHTHLHYDHCQNDGLFSHATFLIQADEIMSAEDGGAFYEPLDRLRLQLDERIVALSGDVDVRPGVRTVLNRGHTPGHQSVLVDTAEGTACICGDIVPLFANVDQVGATCPDTAATLAFLLRARDAGWEMIPSHDPLLRTHRWYCSV